MTEAFAHVFPWTEEEYFALGETVDRIELFDGSLHVSPAPTFEHQDMASQLRDQLIRPARDAGLWVYLAVNVRLRPDRVPIPDLVICPRMHKGAVIADAPDIALVCEITSTNAATDRVLKMYYYAAAGIPWYLLVDPDAPTLSLYRLDGDHYVLDQQADAGQRLRLSAPVSVELDPAALTR